MSWAEEAACRGRDTALWFRPPEDLGTAVALAVCRRCPVRRACLADALAAEAGDGQRYGVRGGLGAGARAALSEGRGQARALG